MKKVLTKKVLTTGALAAGLMAFSTVSSAAVYDFQAWLTDPMNGGEQGFTNAMPVSFTNDGLTLTATAFESTGAASHVYMDDFFNVAIGGMGVCTTLVTDNQCSPGDDDNVSVGEILSWDFSQAVNSLTLELGDFEHAPYNGGPVSYRLDGGLWFAAVADASAVLTIDLAGGFTEIDFRVVNPGDASEFYIQNANASVVPVPAAVWLFGSGLLGLAGFMRRS